jgi:hypothetical protein
MSAKARRGNAPFSTRIPPEMRTHLKAMAVDRQISEGAYLCALIASDMGKRSRRPSTRNVMLREQLKKIHEAIIGRGDRITAGQCDCCRRSDTDGQKSLNELVNITTALLHLEDAVRGK